MTSEQDRPDVVPPEQSRDPAGTVLAYHRRSMHRQSGYARGPETLDWDAQPDPWRTWSDTSHLRLPLVSDGLAAPYAALTGQAQVEPAPLTVISVAALLELAFGLSAWKEIGPDRWAVRCNPSSGNLHPTEAYVISQDVPGLPDGVHHYDSRDHALAHRGAASHSGGHLWVGLTSILWREAWKYGERAFRYCQLDIGHAVGALEAAAATLGWRITEMSQVHSAAVAGLLGTNRSVDFAGVEDEEAELIVAIDVKSLGNSRARQPERCEAVRWHGTPSRVDPRPMYRWPGVEEAAGASRGRAMRPAIRARIPGLPAPAARAASIILGRRSAQRYHRHYEMPLGSFARILDACRPAGRSNLDLVIFVHSVETVEPGIYALPRDHDGAPTRLQAALDPEFLWESVAALPETIPLRRLVAADVRKVIRALTCHQAIAADACATLCLLSDFAPLVDANPWRYRELHREAGRLGHKLYLEAEAAGLSGTGIGCFFDDAIHDLLGIATADRQALYHFAIGRGLADERITTTRAYGERSRGEVPVWR